MFVDTKKETSLSPSDDAKMRRERAIITGEQIRKYWLILPAGCFLLAAVRMYFVSARSEQETIALVIIGLLSLLLLLILLILIRGAFIDLPAADYYLGKLGTEFDEKTKWEIYRAAGGRCQKCWHRCIKGSPSTIWEFILWLLGWRSGQIDHIIHKSRGGSGKTENGRLLCSKCNQSRSNTIDDDALELAEENGETIEIQ